MSIEQFRQQLPEFAKDIKLNLTTVLTPEGAPDLIQDDIDAIALACAYSSQNETFIKTIINEVQPRLSAEFITAAQLAATIMAMNNVYYRFTHSVTTDSYSKLPAKLRMNAMANPPISKKQFELYCLAVSAINNCSFCMDSHTKKLEQEGYSQLSIQSTIRIAAIIKAAAQAQTIIDTQ